MYDYIVVGAGIYGLLITYKLNLDGKKVLLVDKKEIKKKCKLQYMIISNKSYSVLNELLNEEVDNFIYKNYNSIIVAGNKIDTKYHILDLKKIKNYILNNIKNVDIKFSSKIDKYLFKDNKLIIDCKEYNYKNLIAADGTLSEIRLNISRKLQKFDAIASIKYKKNKEDNIIFFDKKYKLFEEIIKIRTNNYIRIINKQKKNNIFMNIKKIKNKYSIDSNSIDLYLIPRGNIILNKNNIYFIGDASGIIDPLNHLTMDYNLDIISIFPYITKKKTNNIKRQILIKKVISKFMYLPIIDKLVIKIISKIERRKYDKGI